MSFKRITNIDCLNVKNQINFSKMPKKNKKSKIKKVNLNNNNLNNNNLNNLNNNNNNLNNNKLLIIGKKIIKKDLITTINPTPAPIPNEEDYILL